MIALVVITFTQGLFADNCHGPKTKEVKKQANCPVMGGKVNEKLFVDHDGKRIYVCCPGCIATIKKDPAKYIKKLEAEGVTLDKTPINKQEDKPKPGKTTSPKGCCP